MPEAKTSYVCPEGSRLLDKSRLKEEIEWLGEHMTADASFPFTRRPDSA
jgi:hypothetical protein